MTISTAPSRPLLSLVLITYNQEAFVEEAVRGALAQTYSPLELIIADDASRDGTVSRIRAVVAGYQGPHSISLLTSDQNLGLAGNLNRAMAAAQGRLIVGAAGDDVSLPDRVQKIYACWLESGGKATSIFSNYQFIDQRGHREELGKLPFEDSGDRWSFGGDVGALLKCIQQGVPRVHGCTHAWARSLFEDLGPLTTDLEDRLLSFRSFAFGEIRYLDEPLVLYRRHASNLSFIGADRHGEAYAARETRLRWNIRSRQALLDTVSFDLQRLLQLGRISPEGCRWLSAETSVARNLLQLESRVTTGSWLQRVAATAAGFFGGRFRIALKWLPRCLPIVLHRCLYGISRKFYN